MYIMCMYVCLSVCNTYYLNVKCFRRFYFNLTNCLIIWPDCIQGGDIHEMGRYSLEKSWEKFKTYFQKCEWKSSTQAVWDLNKKLLKTYVPKTKFVNQLIKRVCNCNIGERTNSRTYSSSMINRMHNHCG